MMKVLYPCWLARLGCERRTKGGERRACDSSRNILQKQQRQREPKKETKGPFPSPSQKLFRLATVKGRKITINSSRANFSTTSLYSLAGEFLLESLLSALECVRCFFSKSLWVRLGE